MKNLLNVGFNVNNDLRNDIIETDIQKTLY